MAMEKMQNYINGEWVESKSTTIGDVWCPAAGEKIAEGEVVVIDENFGIRITGLIENGE